MPKEHLSIEEIEDLGYYDFMGYMEVPFFNVGGAASIDRLAELCDLVFSVVEVRGHSKSIPS